LSRGRAEILRSSKLVVVEKSPLHQVRVKYAVDVCDAFLIEVPESF
jgi:hypothetical protein